MRIYQSVAPVPSRVLGLLRLLATEPKRGMARQTVIDLLQPISIRTREESDNLAVESIGAAIELGLIEEDVTTRAAERLRISPIVTQAESIGASLEARLPSLVAQRALAPEVQGEPNQFARVCAWLLLQTPTAMPQGHNAFKVRLKSHGLNLDSLGLRNDPRWDNVIYWSTYLGLTWQTTAAKCVGVVPDPTTFLQRHLDELLPVGSTTPVQQFRASLGQLCPVLDGGAVHREVAETLVRAGALTPRYGERLSSALSLALRVLKVNGIVDYWCPDDQRVFLLMSGDEKIAFLSRGGRSATS